MGALDRWRASRCPCCRVRSGWCCRPAANAGQLKVPSPDNRIAVQVHNLKAAGSNPAPAARHATDDPIVQTEPPTSRVGRAPVTPTAIRNGVRQWPELAASRMAALECATATSGRSFVGIGSGGRRPTRDIVVVIRAQLLHMSGAVAQVAAGIDEWSGARASGAGAGG